MSKYPYMQFHSSIGWGTGFQSMSPCTHMAPCYWW